MSSNLPARRRRRSFTPAGGLTLTGGFTLVELLVVIGIIAVLIGILVPTLSAARSRSQRVACQAQLRDLGNMFQLYFHDNRQRVMRVNPVPSDPALLPYPAPSIVEVFRPYHRGATNVFRCPSDRLMVATALTGPGGQAIETYFERDGTSYEYNAFFNAYATDPKTGINRVYRDALADARERPPLKLSPDRLPLLIDFEAFHGRERASKNHNALYADFHVAPLDLPVPKTP